MSPVGDAQGQPGIICIGRESYGNSTDFLRGSHLPSLKILPKGCSGITQVSKNRDVLTPAAGPVAGFLSSPGIVSGQYDPTYALPWDSGLRALELGRQVGHAHPAFCVARPPTGAGSNI